MEGRLNGVWLFEKVTHKKGGSWKVNVSDDYWNSTLKLVAEDSTLKLYNHKENTVDHGFWEVYTYTNYDNENDNEDEVHDLYLFIKDTISGGYETRIWTDFKVRRKCLKTKEDRDNGKYTYTFRRIGS